VLFLFQRKKWSKFDQPTTPEGDFRLMNLFNSVSGETSNINQKRTLKIFAGAKKKLGPTGN